MTNQTIGVIGAGITGILSAYELAKRGYAVTIYDRRRYPAMDTSFANGGQLSASNSEVWNHLSTVRKGLAWMMKADAPLSLSLSPSWHKYSWLAEFIRHIPDYTRNTIETARLASASTVRLRNIAKDESISFDDDERGIIHFYSSQTQMDHARRVSELLSKGGVVRHELAPQDIHAMEPALKGDFVGGFHTPADATGDIHMFTNGLADACKRLGVSFELDTEVIDLRSENGGIEVKRACATNVPTVAKHSAIVVCAGVGSRAIAARLGDRVNVYPVKGYSITVNLNDDVSREAAPTYSLLDDDAKIVTSRLGPNRFRVAGTAEFAGINRDIRHERVDPIVRWVNRYFPSVSTRQCVPWAGLRPMMPSMLPKVGPGRRPGVFYNTGHGHLGWTLSAATAELLAGMVEKHL